MLAYDFPILGLFWTLFMFFIWFAWIMLLFRVFGDIFRSDISGIAKGFWAVFVIITPLVGVLLYLIVHGSSMTKRNIAMMEAQDEAFRSYIRHAGGGQSAAAELQQLADLHKAGALTDAEFQAQKAKLLAN